MSEWRETTLGELFEADNTRLGEYVVEPTVMSLSKHDGFVRAVDYFDRRIASEKLDQYKVVEPGEWAFSTIHIDEGSIARNSLGETGVISPMYTTMRWRTDRSLPEFAELLVREPRMIEQYGVWAQGSINRRRSLPFKAFAAIPITLPPLDEQRRIVDVIAAVDDAMDLLEREAAALVDSLRRFLATEFGSLEAPQYRIVDLCTTVIGGIWGDPPGESEVDVLALGPRVFGLGTTSLRAEGSPVRSASARRVAERLIRPGDIVLERSGGSPEQPVGRVVIADGPLPPTVPTDFQRLLRPDPTQVEPRFLFWRLHSDWCTGVSVGYSRRTTGITNLSVTDYISRAIPVPDRDAQRRVVAAADAFDAVRAALSVELAALRSFRSTLLTSLLNQEIEVPDSYDVLMDGAA